MDQAFIYEILPKVSRTFALSIKALPNPIKLWTAHSYLICRLLDTFEDDPILSLADKRKAISIIQSGLISGKKCNLKLFVKKISASTHEKILIKKSDELIAGIKNYPEPVKKTISQWANEMAIGMKKYSFSKSRGLKLINTINDLDEYCYYVAGTVGHMFTDMFLFHSKTISEKRKNILIKNKVYFGKALQLVNIIKDSSSDYLENRCFIPMELFKKNKITIKEFFKGNQIKKNEKIYSVLIKKAEKYLKNAVLYTESIPKKHYRVRVFCILPILLAYKTLNLLKDNIPALIKNPGQVKITRKEVKKAIRQSIPSSLSNKYFRKAGS